ncbi:MAG: RluA family pseudouridine synthase [Pseudomonadota bacterium]
MPEETVLHFVIPDNLAGERIDRVAAFLAGGELTRSKVRRLIDEGSLLLNGSEARRPSQKVAAGQKLDIFIPPPPPSGLIAQDIPLAIVHEDGDLIVLNKPSGMVVHPAAGNHDGTLVNALLFHNAAISGGEPGRPGIVHRLDKDTSGLMLVAKNEKTHALLSAMFASKNVSRQYEALVFGRPPGEGVIDTPYGRSPRDRKKFTGRVKSDRKAVTRFRREEYFEKADVSRVRLILETGRTHQIRVHMSESGWPVIGDGVYGKSHTPAGLRGILEPVDHTLLHSGSVAFVHPTSGQWLEFSADPEKIFLDTAEKLQYL